MQHRRQLPQHPKKLFLLVMSINTPIDLPLKDIHLPDPISWWPLAPGWWILLIVIIFFLSIIILIANQLFIPTVKKQAKVALKSIELRFQTDGNASQCIRDLSQLIRRTVLSSHTYQNAAGLTGMAWLELLDKDLNTPEFSQGAGISLLDLPYQSQAERENAIQLINLCRKWIKRL